MYDIQKIIQHLDNQTLFSEIHVSPSTPSTMDWAKESAKNGEEDFTLFLTEEQTQTRGRFQRAYFSDPNGIYMSLLLNPTENVEELPKFTLIAAVAVVSAIENLTGKKANIKWVNDIYLDGKKLAGILSEAVVNTKTNRIDHVIIGIGFNFAIADFPAPLDQTATSLFENPASAKVSKEMLIAEIWEEFSKWRQKDFLTKYQELSFVLGEEIQFEKGGEEITGIARSIDENGELYVEISPNQKIKLSSGDISLKRIGNKIYKPK